MSLFQECVDSLKKEVIVYAAAATLKIFEEFQQKNKFTFYGRIDWSTFQRSFKINNLDDIRKHIVHNEKCYILWNDTSFPVLETSLQSVYMNVDNVLAVSYDTWLYVFEKNIVIEFYHDGEITIGFIDSND
ncbi:hypothetical protein SGQ83_09050 [Flavobacterium sp. Fl-318]|uniref:Uncharacterized protein n=1 Tax=Flavobacterium cupriresistens TaxID=2893885 RepID=A0ABU4RCA9_9FLAO|nr:MULTISPECIES: hypothetical protein [unclassified Flavobacterium]MDX6189493.1 hypothetical protein [Flavobacterium sp. Fl-318]UFH41098.1 hypothetical protein LNP23_14905 [Flavobacterium sp. F-323]